MVNGIVSLLDTDTAKGNKKPRPPESGGDTRSLVEQLLTQEVLIAEKSKRFLH